MKFLPDIVLLATPQQKPGESLGEYLQELRQLNEEEYCAFKSLTAEQYREELINDLVSQLTHQRLLGNGSVDYNLPATSLLLWTWLKKQKTNSDVTTLQ